MSIERPSEATIHQFLQVQQYKKHTGNFYPSLPVILGLSFTSTIFLYSIYKSMNPSGIVIRILYEKTLSWPKRHLRHLAPTFIGVGTLYIWDCINGVWTSKS